MNDMTRRGAIAAAAVGAVALTDGSAVAAQDEKDDRAAGIMRDVLIKEWPTDPGVHKEIHVMPELLNKVNVVLSANRREIWLSGFAGYPKLVVKHDVPADAIAAILTLKAAKKPFWLWVTNIKGESASLGHLVDTE